MHRPIKTIHIGTCTCEVTTVPEYRVKNNNAIECTSFWDIYPNAESLRDRRLSLSQHRNLYVWAMLEDVFDCKFVSVLRPCSNLLLHSLKLLAGIVYRGALLEPQQSRDLAYLVACALLTQREGDVSAKAVHPVMSCGWPCQKIMSGIIMFLWRDGRAQKGISIEVRACSGFHFSNRKVSKPLKYHSYGRRRTIPR